ncbi:peptide deformylase [Anaplasma platys]|uniref:peptide deformylase n=1 Tax=Anaplasma platys TaxID=949 RepID=UPI003083F8E4
MRPLVVLPDSRLFLCSEEVQKTDPREELDALVTDMFDTMYANHGIGLAAVQIGVHKRVFVIDLSDRNPEGRARYNEELGDGDVHDGYVSECAGLVIINPIIIEESQDNVAMEEGCLSVPEERESVTRPERIVLEYTDQNGAKKVLRAKGLLARCLQHEIDHLNGTVFLKHISKFKRDLVMEKMKKAAPRRAHNG